MSGNALLELVSAGRAGQGRAGRLREVFEERDGLLAAVGAELLREAKDQAGTRQLIAQLMGRGLLGAVYAALAESDPGAAAQLAQVASRVDGSAERVLKRAAAEARAGLNDEEAGLVAEWLRVLGGVAGRMLERGDARARARMALVWGQAARIARAGEQWLEDSDARVRANAVESLWGRADAEAVEIYRRKLRDPNQRVAANAAVGLYLAGESEAVRALWSMAQEGEPGRRAAAAWAMGRTGDARFLPLLDRMRRMHPVPVMVLRNVAAARERIRHSEEMPRRAAEVEGAAGAVQGDLRVDVRVTGDEGAPVQGLRAVDFCLEVNGEVVWDYRVQRKPPAEGAKIWLAAPGETREEIEEFRKTVTGEAGEAGRWVEGVLGYAGQPAAGGQKVGDVLGLGGAGGAGEGVPARSLEGWRQLAEQCVRRMAGAGTERHLVVLVRRGAPEWMAEGIELAAEMCAEAGARLDVLREAGAWPEAGRAPRRRGMGAVLTVQRGEFGEGLRRLAESWSDGWRVEAPGVDARAVRKVRVGVRNGVWRGEAELEREGR
ncbi:MAG: HEAT repeat domain-containing protein [Bryobacteraceae bacterium]